MQRPLLLLTLLSLLFVASTSKGVEATVTESHGVSFSQLDFPDFVPPIPDSATGVFDANLLNLRDSTGIDSGFLNVVMDGEWVVKNMVVPAENEFPYANVFTRFDLMVPEGTDVAAIDATVMYSDDIYVSTPPASPTSFTVAGQDAYEGGVVVGEGEEQSNAEAARPPTVRDLLFADNPADTTRVLQLDHPNVQAAKNQCLPMAVANSLKFLVNTTDLELPHSHVPGLKGDNSLVGQLDTHMRRNVTSRAVGSGVAPAIGIIGKLSYLAANGLQDRVQTRHWGRDVFNGESIGVTTLTVQDSGTNNRADSTAYGQTFDIDDITSAMGRGENCEAIYSWPAGPGRRNAHAVDIVASGETGKLVKRPWVFLASDLMQNNDRDGTRAYEFHLLADPDGNGYYNLAANKELDHLICQKYIPEATTETSLLPDPGTDYNVGNATTIETAKTDVGGHALFVALFAALVFIVITGNALVISSTLATALITSLNPAGTGSSELSLPFEEVQVIEAEELPDWMKFENIVIDPEGKFEGQNEATVAGFSNVTTTIAGEITPSTVKATFTIGAGGELPGGSPLIYELEFTPESPFPWTQVPVAPELSPAIRVNGMREAHTVASGDPISIGLSIEKGEAAGPRDWWIIAQSGDLTASYDLASGTFVEGITPTYQGELMDLPNTGLFQSMGGLPPGEYKFYFGVDAPNGQPDLETIVFDFMSLTVEDNDGA